MGRYYLTLFYVNIVLTGINVILQQEEIALLCLVAAGISLVAHSQQKGCDDE